MFVSFLTKKIQVDTRLILIWHSIIFFGMSYDKREIAKKTHAFFPYA